MKLLKLTLTNFKGCRSFVFEPDGKNASVFGDNATFKTTLYDSFLWLLHGKDSQNKKDFDIKTLDANNQPLHGLDHEVEGVFDVDGRQLTLKKRYAEQWTKKRGTATAVLTGHTNDHFVDGVPVSAGEYADKIAEVATEDMFKLLTNPKYFNEQLHWEKRRELLLKVCGDVSDRDVIASSEKLKALPAILGDRSLDNHRKVIKSRQAEINNELKKIPVRIDESQRGLPDVAGLNVEKLTLDKGSLNVRLTAKRAEKSRIESGGEVAEKTKALRLVEGQLLDIRNKHRAAVDEKVKGKRSDLDLLLRSYMDLQLSVGGAKKTAQKNLEAVAALEKVLERLRAEWHEVNGTEFKCPQSDACPVCGQAFPEEYIESVKEKALANFNKSKAERLEEINAQGKREKEAIAKLLEENIAFEAEIESGEKELRDSREAEAKLQAEIDAMLQGAGDPTATAEYKAATRQKEALESDIDTLKTGNNELLTMVQEEIEALEAEIREKSDALESIDRHQKGQARIAELMDQEKALAKEFERLEQEQFLTEEFIRTKVAMLDSKVNSRFKLARFKMFDVQINGGVDECCETLYEGVPYNSNLNAGHKIIVGLDIINTLSDFYGFSAPIFVDNAESVTQLPEINAQVIRLVKPEIETEEARKKYSKMVVEVEKETLF